MSKSGGLVIFSHIPKTAGTSVLRVIERNYGENEREFLYGPEGERRTDAIARGVEELSDVRCLCLHQASKLVENVPDSFRVFSVLRHPVERSISLYHHVLAKGKPGEEGHRVAERIRSLGWSLEDIYRNLDGIDPRQHGLQDFFDAQTFMTCSVVGMGDRVQPPVSLARKVMKRAGRPLKREPRSAEDAADLVEEVLRVFAERGNVLGVTENLERSVARFADAFGWVETSVTRENVGERPRHDEVSDELRDLIYRNNPLDALLWERVSASFGPADSPAP